LILQTGNFEQVPVRIAVALVANICLLVIAAPIEVLAQTDAPVERADQTAPPFVVAAPGGGYWLVFPDGEVTPIATDSPTPIGDALVKPGSGPRSTGQLAGVLARQYLSGLEGDIELACMSDLSFATRLGQTLMPAFDWQDLRLASVPLAKGLIGGVVVLGSPPGEVSETIAELRKQAPIPPLFAVDEEGGRVQRLRNALGVLPSAREQARQFTPTELRRMISAHGQEVRALGFDLNFAPVLDVGGGPGIGDRAYGDDPELVTEYGLAVVAGLEDAGLVPVVKHFPGHGRASIDSHVDLARTPPLSEMLAVDLAPFRAAIDSGVTAVMVGHLDVPGLTDAMPASLSPEAVQGLLRTEMGFEGLVISDALDMGAITLRWSTAEAVELALNAGVDLLLLGNVDELDAISDRIIGAVEAGRLDERRVTEAATRVMATKGLNTCALFADSL